MLFIFFFKQKTAYEMRIRDWSSDVCSSDLNDADAETDTGGIETVEGDFDSVEEITADGADDHDDHDDDHDDHGHDDHGHDDHGHDDHGHGHHHDEPALAAGPAAADAGRSEGRRVGTAGVGTSRSRWSTCP